MSEKLKPCPLCGADAEVHYEKLCGTTIYMVKCSADKCQCQEMGWHETETDATNVWNTRPIDDALQARIAELEKENASIKKAMEKAAKSLYKSTQSCPSDMFDWEHPATCDIECNTHSHVDDAWKCWLDWLMNDNNQNKGDKNE